MSEAETKYDHPGYCNACGVNGLSKMIIDSVDGYASEIKTKCNKCGFEDYWGCGFFESGMKGFNRARKYTSKTAPNLRISGKVDISR